MQSQSMPVIARASERDAQEFYTGTLLEVCFMCWSFDYFKKAMLEEKPNWRIRRVPVSASQLSTEYPLYLTKVKLDNLITVWDWKDSRMENVGHAVWTRRQIERGVRSR